ncbi:hypothetical protein GCM10008955_40930 [Deinococcus malanensis]|uniref:DUF541 domain-containing protein n=1 Tax=Deinococcus malanensis TaxID=1706855 RepID=A0ABQ2F312_9DEIO|nr:hypothetical protein GCM10008955_40930 [Deinococcus malanensis]
MGAEHPTLYATKRCSQQLAKARQLATNAIARMGVTMECASVKLSADSAAQLADMASAAVLNSASRREAFSRGQAVGQAPASLPKNMHISACTGLV